MDVPTVAKRSNARAEALRAEGAQCLKAIESAGEGSELHKALTRRIIELAPLVAMLDAHSQPPNGIKR